MVYFKLKKQQVQRMCSTAGSATFLGKSKNGTGRHIRGCVIKRGSRKADKPKSKVEKQKKK